MVEAAPAWNTAGVMRTTERELAPQDIGQLVRALLAGIERGELEASPKEIDFLNSVAEMLTAERRTN